MLGKVTLSACRKPRAAASWRNTVGPGMVGRQQQIAAEQLVRFELERLLDAVGQKADAGQRGHRQHQGDTQHGQFAGAPVAGEHAPGEPQG